MAAIDCVPNSRRAAAATTQSTGESTVPAGVVPANGLNTSAKTFARNPDTGRTVPSGAVAARGVVGLVIGAIGVTNEEGGVHRDDDGGSAGVAARAAATPRLDSHVLPALTRPSSASGMSDTVVEEGGGEATVTPTGVDAALCGRCRAGSAAVELFRLCVVADAPMTDDTSNADVMRGDGDSVVSSEPVCWPSDAPGPRDVFGPVSAETILSST